MMNIAVIGSGAREHILSHVLCGSSKGVRLFVIGSTSNPGIMELCEDYQIGDITDAQQITKTLLSWKIDLAVIGPEAPLETGTADTLRAAGIAVFGPDRKNARIETSKSYARELLGRYAGEANPICSTVTDIAAAQQLLDQLGEKYVIKAEGLCGGKGVKVAGDHLHSHEEALLFISGLLEKDGSCLIEEKLIGEEFSLMSITDGEHCIHLPAVQDHKRAYRGDTGPNTGGMGSYSDADGSLPFLTSDDISSARGLNEKVIAALKEDNGQPYRGVLYGGFMATADGVRIIEYNARFGDPEVMNLLSVIDADFPELFKAAAEGALDTQEIVFKKQASVCKYAVPEGYPELSVKGEPIRIGDIPEGVRMFLGSVDLEGAEMVTAGSRTVAVVAVGESIGEAEQRAEQAVSGIAGKLFHREDIGTQELIARRTAHMKELRS